MAYRGRRVRRRGGETKVLLVVLAFVAYSGLVVYQRFEVRERAGRIERLEQRLQEARTDEQLTRLKLDQACAFPAVQQHARERWGMTVADATQRVLLRGPAEPAVEAQPASRTGLASRLTRLFRPEVAMASTAAPRRQDDGTGSR
ncbi:MAG: hypothetical protein ACE15D_08635 [Candidatus Eisenbacteria bacterium]